MSFALLQLLRYGVVGFFTNAVGYLLYFFATAEGLEPKLAMTVIYVMGILVNFWGNRWFTFLDKSSIARVGVRYLYIQMIGYLLNLALLGLFVDLLKFPHEFVQAAAIFVVALFLFLASKYYVFSSSLAKKENILE